MELIDKNKSDNAIIQDEIIINKIYDWCKNYVIFPEHYNENKRLAVRDGLRILIDDGVFQGYQDLRKTLLKECFVLLPISALKYLAVR